MRLLAKRLGLSTETLRKGVRLAECVHTAGKELAEPYRHVTCSLRAYAQQLV